MGWRRNRAHVELKEADSLKETEGKKGLKYIMKSGNGQEKKAIHGNVLIFRSHYCNVILRNKRN